ncbi:MAG: hypothetical protein ABIT05_00465 [Chitinophagaceae bacterium]
MQHSKVVFPFKFSLAVFILTMFGCVKANPHENPFAGHWKGTYTGANDQGTWDIVLDKDGFVTGNTVSTTFAQTNTASGVVSEQGQVSLLITIGTVIAGASFNGNMTGHSASGTWTNNTFTPPYTGTWTGSKL